MAGPALYVQWNIVCRCSCGCYSFKLSAQELESTDDEAHACKGIDMLTRYTIVLFIVNERNPQLAASLQGPPFDKRWRFCDIWESGHMNTSDYAAVAAMFLRAVPPALVPAGQANYGVVYLS
ncbi:uncharacterized protein ARMOST_21861 [Armillaria ostoyae]|uniref:Uncharacterized protein n=1 Tax=Armillaria ostoyae TaxID=47428 RepID=A0A284SBB7_ARMOS|nr:uncharacterized protein ARMOST_21861 [Armillaria ostoyae]